LAGLLLLLVYLAASMRHLDAAGNLFVVERLKGLGTPRLVDPGWRFVPRLLGRVSIYPTEPVDIQVDSRGEGVRALRRSLSIDPSQAAVRRRLEESAP
jgi:hypothetical protein